MLSIGKLSLGQTAYYERSVAQGVDDYYSGRGEVPGRWVGAGAERLGLSGRVAGEQFQALMAGRDPVSDTQLARRTERSVAALDLTFSAPKSVSILFAVADADVTAALVDAHERSVDAALAYLAREACLVRRGHAGGQVLQAQGFVTAAYRHRMSRAQDPQLHTHCVTANIAQGPDGRWTALHGRALYEHAKAGGHVYQAELRRRVRKALPWARWGPVCNGMAELQGIDPGVLRAFSQRRAQIEQREAELVAAGVAVGDAGRELITHTTREAKDEQLETPVWRERVRVRAEEHGFGRRELARLFARTADPAPPVEQAWEQEERRLVGPSGLTAQRNTFARRDVVIAFAQAARDGASARQLEAASGWFVTGAEVIALDATDGADRHSVTGLIDCERAIVKAADGRVAAVDPHAIDRAIGRRGVSLTAEQELAVRRVCGSGRAIEVIEALAGTGKTTTAGVIADVYRGAGREVIGIAPTGRAVRELKENAGIDRSLTLAQLLLDAEHDGVGFDHRPTVVLLDEAAMAPTREVDALVRIAAAGQVQVVAIGDSGQLPSVQAGGWIGAVSRRHDAARLTQVMRQRDPRERLMLEQLHRGEPDDWIENKLLAGQLRIAGAPSAEHAAVSAWRAKADEVGLADAVLITRNNHLRARLTAAIRAAREAELGARRRYGERELAVGDRIICRRNNRRLDVDNGTRGTITSLTPTAVIIRTDSGGERQLPANYCATDLEHGYVLTAHGMQGATVEWAAVVASPRELTRNWSYTALSRARQPTELFVIDELSESEQDSADLAPLDDRPRRDPLGEIARTMRHRDDEDAAIDQLPYPDSPTPHIAGEPSTSGTTQTRSLDQIPIQQLDTSALRAELTTITGQIGAATRRRDPSTDDPQFAEAVERGKELRAELTRRRKEHVARALANPPDDLIAALGPRPDDPRKRADWEARVRRYALFQVASNSALDVDPLPVSGRRPPRPNPGGLGHVPGVGIARSNAGARFRPP